MKTLWDTLATKTRKHKGLNLSIFGILVPLWLILPANLLGIDFEPLGFLDTYHAVVLNDPHDFLSSRTRLRFEMWITGEDAFLFTSMNAINNNVISSNSGIELREAFIDYSSDNCDIRIGRQLIIWGKADGLEITDIISPKDYSEFLAQDFDDIRLPIDALKFRFLFEQTNLELIWLPVFKPAILPPADSPWEMKYETHDFYEEWFPTVEPEMSLKNSEIAAKISTYQSGFDLAITAFHSWEDIPTMHREVYKTESVIDSVYYFPEHHRLSFLGFEFSIPHKDFVFRVESAFYKDRYFQPASMHTESLFRRNELNWMLGIDWSPGNNWSVTGQLADNFILDYDEKIKNDEHTFLSTLNVSKQLFRQTLKIFSMIYYGINDEEYFIRTGVDYALTDELHLLTGIDLFCGDEGMLGQYNDNDEFWIKAKYSF
ncbi:MAG: hypothetical protein KAW92_12715 [Candidatus Cloacimonetes bacterium]|nr:hypothetical protein [Candidatus Cloacimonadota bacterium]